MRRVPLLCVAAFSVAWSSAALPPEAAPPPFAGTNDLNLAAPPLTPQSAAALAKDHVSRHYPHVRELAVRGVRALDRKAGRLDIKIFEIYFSGVPTTPPAGARDDSDWQLAYVLQEGSVIPRDEFAALFPSPNGPRVEEPTVRVVVKGRPLNELLQIYSNLTGKPIVKRVADNPTVEFVQEEGLSRSGLISKIETYLLDVHGLRLVPNGQRLEVRSRDERAAAH